MNILPRLLGIGGLLCLLPATAMAVTHYVDADATTGADNGTSWANAYLDLQSALGAAASGDEIWVAEGVYTPGAARTSTFNLVSGVVIYGGFAGTEANPSQRMMGANETILSGDIGTSADSSDNCYNVVTTSLSNASTIMDGLTIRDGYGVDASSTDREGGGINMDGSLTQGTTFLTMRFCRILDNQTGFGGAIYFGVNSDLTLENCELRGNSAVIGGALLSGRDVVLTLESCNFSGNAAHSGGGAINLGPDSDVTAHNCVFSGNSGSTGAFSKSDGFATFTNCTFQGNRGRSRATIVNGGGAVNLANCLLWGNDPGGDSEVEIIGGAATYSHCLIDGFNPPGPGNLDGTDPFNAPDFVAPIDPASAPASGGDLRLFVNSAGVDAGLDSSNMLPTDIAGNPRIVDTIDIGAYELLVADPIYVDVTRSGANNGTSWAAAFSDLQSALAIAESGDEIWVADGTYKPTTDTDRNISFVVPTGVSVLGGFAGDESSRDERDASENPTILSGELGNPSFQSDNTYRIITATGNILVDSLTLRDAIANGQGAVQLIGNGTAPVYRRCTLANNRGAAITVFQQSFPRFEGCTFIDNENTSGGGAVTISLGNGGTFIDCRFLNNTSSTAGGAISCNQGEADFFGCLFSGNEAESGGGACRGRLANLSFFNCSFANNRVTDFNSSGGALSITIGSIASFTMKNSVLWKNFNRGNGFFESSTEADSSFTLDDFTNADITNCLVQGRTATYLQDPSNLDGTDPANDPQFVDGDGADDTAGTTDDDLRLEIGSPAIDVGVNGGYSRTTDLGGEPRFLDGDFDGSTIIDLGALETRPPILVREGAAGDGSTWADALPNPQDALAIGGDGDQIWVGAGTYTPGTDRTDSFVLKNGVQLLGGFAGTEAALSERDADPRVDTSWLSGEIGAAGSSDNSYHVVEGTGTDSSAVLDGFAITLGRADDATDRNHLGGGFICDGSGSPTIQNSIFLKNRSDFVGGGMYLNAASPSFTNVAFLGNDAFTVISPGGVSGEGAGAYLNNSNPAFTNCLFALNVADNNGGAISNHNSSPTFVSCTFARNKSFQTGGMIYNASATSNPQLTNVVIWEASGSALSDIITIPNESSYQNTLIQFFTPSAANPGNNYDGNDASMDPNYADPNGADNQLRTLDDDFTIARDSPIVDLGDNSAVTEPLDLANQKRIRNGSVDLGAYEAVFVNFAELYPLLDPEGDENRNGITNFQDYAEGYDPLLPSPSNRLVPDFEVRGEAPSTLYFTFPIRIDAEDVNAVIQSSTTLQSFEDAPSDFTTELDSGSSIRAKASRLISPEPFPDLLFLRRKFLLD